MLWHGVLVIALAQLCISKPLSRRWDDLTEKHAWSEIPGGWEYVSPAPVDYTFNLRIALKQDRIDELISNLLDISDPTHPKYGQHLSKAEAEALVAPHSDSIESVNLWLEHHGIPSEDIVHSTGGGHWVTVRVSVMQAERILGTKYNVYRHSASSQQVVRTMSYSLPRELHYHIDVIAPTTYFSTIRSMRSTSFLQSSLEGIGFGSAIDLGDAATLAGCGTIITPACLRALYNTSSYTPKATSVNQLGVVGYLDEFANRADLQSFLKRYRKDAVGVSYKTVLVNKGGDDQSKPGIEANLDIQYTVGISFPTPNIYYSTAGSPPFVPDSQTTSNTNEPYLDWLKFILDPHTTVPQVITTSYGDNEQTVPPDYARKVCNSFAQLGSMGTTAFFSSGDFGVGGGDCLTNDGTERVLFQPVFPASCPFVTAVGGTTKVSPEVAVDFSGGGFSRYFEQPSYQNTAVSKYLSNLGTQFSGLYNASGRAYPDLSAQGSGFQVIVNGSVVSVGGTSASSPTVAGIFALLNDFRLAKGKHSLGFINPLLYSTAATGFNDIVSGSNPGCGTKGFTASEGWDPVTGLGTPDFLKLQALVG